MIEEKEEAGVGPAGMAANDRGDDPGAGRDFPDEGAPASPEERLVAVEAELADTKDRLLRALAETENVRRRFQREREDVQKYAISGFAKDLLSAVDNLRRALDGVRRIDPKGERFDHNFHQAIFEAERPGAPAGTVIEVLQPGYVLHDRLLRPAMVGVAKGGAKSRSDES